jgi:ABC-type transporter Mla MlaB component
MRLVGEARKVDIKLSVADVFRSGTLWELARSVQPGPRNTQPTLHAKLMSDAKMESLLNEIAALDLEHVHRLEVADVLPVTSVQERCLAGGIAPAVCNDNEKLRTLCQLFLRGSALTDRHSSFARKLSTDTPTAPCSALVLLESAGKPLAGCLTQPEASF